MAGSQARPAARDDSAIVAGGALSACGAHGIKRMRRSAVAAVKQGVPEDMASEAAIASLQGAAAVPIRAASLL